MIWPTVNPGTGVECGAPQFWLAGVCVGLMIRHTSATLAAALAAGVAGLEGVPAAGVAGATGGG